MDLRYYCTNCEKLKSNTCGEIEKLRITAGAVQYRKLSDERCSKGKKKHPRNQVAEDIYIDYSGYFEVEVFGEFVGRYAKLFDAVRARKSYFERNQIAEY